MRPTPPTQRGFTLFEIIIVLAVISTLVAILTPRVLVYIDDANQIRAQADANAIAAAIGKMYKDTGRWPFYKDGTGKLAYTDGTDYALLTSNPVCTGATSAYSCDGTVPEDATLLPAPDSWNLNDGSHGHSCPPPDHEHAGVRDHGPQGVEGSVSVEDSDRGSVGQELLREHRQREPAGRG